MTEQDRHDRNYKIFACIAVGGALVVTLGYGLWVSPKGHTAASAMAALLTAGAPFAIGGFLGFLFGIPKTLQAPSDPSAPGQTGRRHGWQANTNLEQVSDWLTKILIGVGLTELQKVPGMVQDTGEYLADALGKDASASVVAAMLVVFSVSGFVIGYLLTKFDLGRALDEQDGALGELAKAIIRNPNDREAVESFLLGTLYNKSPEGFESAIRAGEAFLSQEGHPQPQDGNVFAYLACAYGQKHAWQVANGASEADQQATLDKVVAYATAAIERDSTWKARLRQLVNPPVGSSENDLASLKDDSSLKNLLEMT